MDTLGEKDTWEFYQGNRGKWRWRRTAVNGLIVGASTQGYVDKSECLENAIRHGYKKDD